MDILKTVSVVMIFITVFPLRFLWGMEKNRPTLVVAAVHNGNGDVESEDAAKNIEELLRSSSKINVVDRRKTENVLKYYDRTVKKEDSTEIEQLLARAKDSYYNFNYPEAKALAQKAAVLIESDPNHAFNNGTSLIDSYLTLGIVLRSMGNVGEARQAFLQALRLDPEFKLDSRAFPPSTVGTFESVKAELDKMPKGGLKISSDPKAADVYVNGVIKGVTPLVVGGLPAGKYNIRLVANKYRTVSKNVEVAEGKTSALKEKLVWLGGKKGDPNGRNYVAADGGFSRMGEALEIADLLKVDKVVIVDVEKSPDGRGTILVQMVDSRYRAGQNPVTYSFNNAPSEKNGEIADKLLKQAYLDIASNPSEYVRPEGAGDPVLMGEHKKKRRISKPVIFGILGGVLAIGLGAGLAAAFAGGGGRSSGSGSGQINVTFK